MKSKRSKKLKSKKSFFNPDVETTFFASAISGDLDRDSMHERITPYHIAEFFRKTQKEALLKKYNPSVPADGSPTQDELETIAFIKFCFINEHMEKFKGKDLYPKPDELYQSSDSQRDLILKRARALLHFVLTPFTEDEWFLACQHSAGSSIGVSFNDTSLEAKFKLPISITSRCIPLFNRYLSHDRLCAENIADLNDLDIFNPSIYREVMGSRATTVDKTASVRRMIAVEPTGNMYFQQGLMQLLTDRLQAVGLDIKHLSRLHTTLAYRSSISSLNATIDFSSASDCVAVDLVKYLFPPKWWRSLCLVKSDFMEIDGSNVRLNMFSTMGNATTFPVETLVFWALAVCTVRTVRSPKGWNGGLLPSEDVFRYASVFGDDCIIPTDSALLFMSVCSSVGFLVNDEKSFYRVDDPFRESCGGDYLSGYNVRPVYIRAPASTTKGMMEPWLYTIGNAVIKKYISYFGSTNYVYDREFFEVFFQCFNRHNILVRIVPDWYPDDSGLKIGAEMHRFRSHYSFKTHKVTRDSHGSYHFTYLRFKFREELEIHEGIRFSDRLKKLVDYRHLSYDFNMHLREAIHAFEFEGLKPCEDRKSRRIGSYVVAKGSTSHWEVSLPKH